MRYRFHAQPSHVCKTRSNVRERGRGIAFAFAVAWPKIGPLAWKFLGFVRTPEGGTIVGKIGLPAIAAERE